MGGSEGEWGIINRRVSLQIPLFGGAGATESGWQTASPGVSDIETKKKKKKKKTHDNKEKKKIIMKPSQGTGLRRANVRQRGRRQSRRQGKAGRSPSHVQEHLAGAGV